MIQKCNNRLSFPSLSDILDSNCKKAWFWLCIMVSVVGSFLDAWAAVNSSCALACCWTFACRTTGFFFSKRSKINVSQLPRLLFFLGYDSPDSHFGLTHLFARIFMDFLACSTICIAFLLVCKVKIFRCFNPIPIF